MSVENGNTGDPLADKLAALTALSFPHFFVGQKLTSDLLNASGDVTRQQLSYLGRLLAGFGVLEGLELQIAPDLADIALIVKSGVAIDLLGRLIVVPQDVKIPCSRFEEFKAKDSCSIEILLHLHARRSDSEPKDQFSWIHHGFRIQVRELDKSEQTKSESEAPTRTFREFVQKSSTKPWLADNEGVSLGVVTLQNRPDVGVQIEATGHNSRRHQILNLNTLSRFLESQRRIVSLRAESPHFQKITVHVPSTSHTVRLVDLNDCGVGNVALEVVASAAEVQLRPLGRDDWQKHGESLSVTTDEQGRIRFECLTTTPGFFVLSVSMRDQNDGLCHPQAVQINVLAAELLFWNEPGPCHAIPGESVTLRIEFRDLKNPETHGYVDFHENEHPGRSIRGQTDPKHGSIISALWPVRRLGYHTIIASFHSPKGVLARVSIPVIGEPTRVLVVGGNYQRCQVGEQLPSAVTLKVETLDQTPVKNAEIKLSGSTWDIDIGIGRDPFNQEPEKTPLRTDEHGEVQFRWTPQEHGCNMITASHIVRNLNSPGHKKHGDETQISMNEVCLFAVCHNASASDNAAVISQETKIDTVTDNDNRTENE